MLQMESIKQLRELRAQWALAGEKIALVPTMGALHQGHLSLVELAKQHSDRVVVSIFVNPTQFGPSEDLEQYPRDFEGDRRKLQAMGVDAVFAPNVGEIYSSQYQTFVENSRHSKILCGESRPIHFRGVLTIVLKLFNLVDPAVAVFGLKDYQQFFLISQMVSDFGLCVKVVGAPIFREDDGLAMSSRNLNLAQSERAVAPILYNSMKAVQSAYVKGEHCPETLVNLFKEGVSSVPEMALDYAEIRDTKTLDLYTGAGHEQAHFFCAAKIGQVRLIDNLVLE